MQFRQWKINLLDSKNKLIINNQSAFNLICLKSFFWLGNSGYMPHFNTEKIIELFFSLQNVNIIIHMLDS